jgi:uncharacterized protein
LPLATPFLEWQWLHTIENSGSAIPRTGWLPNHLTLWRHQTLVAAAPLYVKGHSYGEFVFDHQWADLAFRLGINYYPKLLGMTPFTPAEGYRFLIAAGENEAELTALILGEIDRFCDRNQLSSCHFLFVDPTWQPLLERQGYSAWRHHSYIWQNQGYQSFEDYLQSFNANQRRNIKRERKAIAESQLEVKILTAEEITESLLIQMHDFYSDTCDKFWGGSKYLTQKFFTQLLPDYSHRLVLMVASEPSDRQRPLGMSFCLRKRDRLYGRYWGSRQEIDCLHFEACYYRPIEWAIEQQIQIFDPGAGGQHKKRRGFPARPNHSLHRFYDQRLRQIWEQYIDQINDQEQQDINQINQDLPFKWSPSGEVKF